MWFCLGFYYLLIVVYSFVLCQGICYLMKCCGYSGFTSRGLVGYVMVVSGLCMVFLGLAVNLGFVGGVSRCLC